MPRLPVTPWTPIPIPMNGGIDTKSDPKRVQPPSLLVAENVTQRQSGSLSKRPGFANVGLGVSGVSLVGVGHREDELLAFDGKRIYTQDLDGANLRLVGADSAGAGTYDRLPTCRVTMTEQPLPPVSSGGRGNLIYCDHATIGVSSMYVGLTQSGLAVRWILDSTTGATILAPEQVGAGTCQRIRIFAVGTHYMILYQPVSSNTLYFQAYATSDLYNTSATGTPITDCASGTFTGLDAESDGTDVVVGWESTTATTAKWARITTACAITGSTTSETTTSAIDALAISRNSNGDVAMAWADNTRGDVRTWDSGGTALTSAYNFATTSSHVDFITIVWTSTSAARIFYTEGATAWSTPIIKTATLASTGVTFIFGAAPAARAWATGTGDDNVYLLVFAPWQIQRSYFLVRYNSTSGGTARSTIARILYGLAGWTYSLSGPATLPGVQVLGDGRYAAPVLKDREAGDNTGAGVRLEFDLVAAPRTASIGGHLYTAAGICSHYDGASAQEVGFLLMPEQVTLTPDAISGSMTSSVTYNYHVFYERMYRGYVIERSGSLAFSVTMGATDTEVVLDIPSLQFTGSYKDSTTDYGWRVSIFRTKADSPLPYYYVQSKKGDDTVESISITDTAADGDITSNEEDYLSTLPRERMNDAPEACSLITQVNGRIFVSGFAHDRDLVQYSKERVTQEPVNFSGDNTILVQDGEGPITAIAGLGDSLVVWRERATFLITGAGPDNTGGGGAFDDATTISLDIGCVNADSVVLTPQGLIFESHRGMYILTVDGQLQFIGGPIDDFRTDTIVAAMASSENHEAYLLTSNSRIHVLDYLAGVWYTWTIGGIHGCLWNGRLTLLEAAAGDILAEDSTVYQDDGAVYNFKVVTGWISMAGIGGAERVRQAVVTGEYKDYHVAKLWFAFDFVDTWYGPFTWDTADALAGGKYQFRIYSPRQRFSSICVRIQDDGDGTNTLGDSLTLAEVALEAKVQPSPIRLGDTRKAT